MKVIKVMNDLILGLLMLALSIFLLVSKQVVAKMPAITMGGFFARADIYIRMLAFILAIVSTIVIIKSINFKGDVTQKFTFAINDTIVFSVISLILYTLLMPRIGFVISTFVMLFFLCMLYTIREQGKRMKDYKKMEILKLILRAVIYSVIMVIILKLIFTYGLSVQLP